MARRVVIKRDDGGCVQEGVCAQWDVPLSSGAHPYLKIEQQSYFTDAVIIIHVQQWIGEASRNTPRR